jgi:hypothetical protein
VRPAARPGDWDSLGERMSRKTLVGLACLVLGVSALAAPAQAANKPTKREKAEAAKLVKVLDGFRTAAAARKADVDAALASADAAAAGCPPPAGLPTGTPKSEAEYQRLFTAFSADLFHRDAAIFDPLATELADAAASLRGLKLRVADLRYLAREVADSATETRALTPFDLCGFWTAWKADDLDLALGFARLGKLAGGDAAFGNGYAGGQKRYDRALAHLQRIVGKRRAGDVDGFPIAGRYAPAASNLALEKLATSYGMTD